VPDTYQGSELWDLSLVDPDNRRPVDYNLRRTILRTLKDGMPPEELMQLLDDPQDPGAPKLWLVHQALSLRLEHPECFGADAAYQPLHADGPKREHLVAFLRADRVAALAPRWSLKLGDNWSSTTVDLPQGNWKNLLTGDSLRGGKTRVHTLLRRFPVALLIKETESSNASV
jgi:(1->4)-alpha-D-glucan 1-alpha-D-glucosylmutase